MKNTTKRITLQEVLKEELKDSEFRFYFEHERAVRQIADLVRDARKRAKLTQAGLAKKAKTTQTVIARLESGTDKRIPSLDLLERIARAFKARLQVSFAYQKTA